MLHSPTAAVILILLAGGVNVLRDHLSLVLLVVFFMLIGKSLLEQNTSVQYPLSPLRDNPRGHALQVV